MTNIGWFCLGMYIGIMFITAVMWLSEKLHKNKNQTLTMNGNVKKLLKPGEEMIIKIRRKK